MLAIEVLADRLPPWDPPEVPRLGVCCLLGTTEPCISRHWAIKDTFTQLDLLRSPSSQHVSVRAWRVMTDRQLRLSSWVCDARGWRVVDRRALWRLARSPEELACPWVGYATISGKKHGALLAPVNLTSDRQRWLWEQTVVDTCQAEVEEIASHLTQAAARWPRIPKGCLRSLDPPAVVYRDAAAWTRFVRWAAAYRHTPVYQYLVWLMPLPQEDQEDALVPRDGSRLGGRSHTGAESAHVQDAG